METVTIDRKHNLAYVMYLPQPAERTIRLSPTINVDLSISSEIVGVEFLNTSTLGGELYFPSDLDHGLLEFVIAAQKLVISQL